MKLRLLFALSCLLATTCPAFAADTPVAGQAVAPVAALNQFAWLTGSWTLDNGRAKTEEIWTTPTSNLMLGMGRTIKDGKTVAFEFVRRQEGGDGMY